MLRAAAMRTGHVSMLAPLARMRAIFRSASGRALFERCGAQTYVARVDAFAAERAPLIDAADERLIELEARMAVAKRVIPLVVRDLIAAGYFWALFERWRDEPRRAWKIDREEHASAVRSLVERYDVSTEEAALHLEVAAVKSAFDDLLPARDRTLAQRLASVRDAQVETFLNAVADGERPARAARRGESAAIGWLTECFDWGVAIGLRRTLYERDVRRAKAMLSPPG
jgi:hypothetical protein